MVVFVTAITRMPNDCPRINIADKEDAVFFFKQVREHALKLIKHELARDNMSKDKEVMKACRDAIEGVRSNGC
jgi:hypothetical protein